MTKAAPFPLCGLFCQTSPFGEWMVGGHFWSYPLPQRLKPEFHRRFIAGLKPCAAQKQEQIPPVGRNDKRLCCRSRPRVGMTIPIWVLTHSVKACAAQKLVVPKACCAGCAGEKGSAG